MGRIGARFVSLVISVVGWSWCPTSEGGLRCASLDRWNPVWFPALRLAKFTMLYAADYMVRKMDVEGSASFHAPYYLWAPPGGCGGC
jgi:hypothetical protein